MIAGDEFYPDDVTSGEIDDEECGEPLDASFEDDHWVVDHCSKPCAIGSDRCAEHSL